MAYKEIGTINLSYNIHFVFIIEYMHKSNDHFYSIGIREIHIFMIMKKLFDFSELEMKMNK